MSPSLGFTALTLFNALRFPLSQFPDIITMFITSRASLKRIHEYFVADDTPGLPGLPPQVASKGSIVIKNLTVAWRRVQHDDAVSASKGGKKMQCCQYVYQATIGKIGSLCNFGRRSGDSAGSYPAPLNSTRTDTMYSKLPEEDDTTDVESPLSTLVSSDRSNQRLDDIHVVLRDVNMNILPGGLNVIIGTTGAGKSSLLSAILGETLLLSGERFMTGEVAYSTQTAWIQNATLRDNILFGSPFDPTRYICCVCVFCSPYYLTFMP
ncbi:ATP-binding cassette domain-containing protein [archaeon]|nr:MAG: ATP-binding cassette domain-containing protein [archaeon]